MVLVRSCVYKAVNGTPADMTRGKNGMNRMRKKIGAELETVLGKGFVKEVRFSKYIVL
jgi:flagellar basal body-associated protein FliL